MGQYVTSERRTPGFTPGVHSLREVVNQGSPRYYEMFPSPRGYTAYQPPEPLQTTYSFRTGVRSGAGSDLEQLIESATTHAAVVQGLKTLHSLKSSEYDQGHEFNTQKLSYSWSLRDFTFGYTDNRRNTFEYRGPLWPATHSIFSLDPGYAAWHSLTSLEARGTEAIRDTIPNKSPADLAQALIELKREGLPKLIGLQTLRDGLSPRSTGGEYLNLEFGIKPILRDLLDVATAVSNSRELYKRWMTESGKKLHRQRHFPVVRETLTSGPIAGSGISRWPVLNMQYCFVSNGTGIATTTVEKSRRDYFKGAYTYHIDKDKLGTMLGNAEAAAWLLGLKVTPEVLWEITPWSWLVDWVTNIGDNISNASALGSDGLVLRYGYMMRHTRVTSTRTLVGVKHVSTLKPVPPISFVALYERKQRIRANPYGFQTLTSAFSPKQWSILTALGLTRGNRSLRLND